MPFENCLPQVFSEESIRKNAPTVSGVYGLSNSRLWLYIGETDNIRDSLLALQHVPLRFDPDNDPTGFSFEAIASKGRVDRQRRLIEELAPAFQQRAGQSGRFRRGHRATARSPASPPEVG